MGATPAQGRQRVVRHIDPAAGAAPYRVPGVEACVIHSTHPQIQNPHRPERDLTGVPLEVPNLPEEQYRLPLLVRHMFDCTILVGNDLRPIADQWCLHAMNGLLRACRVVCPLREAAEKSRSAARAAAALLEGDGRSTSSSMSSSDPGAGSAAIDVTAGSSSKLCDVRLWGCAEPPRPTIVTLCEAGASVLLFLPGFPLVGGRRAGFA